MAALPLKWIGRWTFSLKDPLCDDIDLWESGEWHWILPLRKKKNFIQKVQGHFSVLLIAFSFSLSSISLVVLINDLFIQKGVRLGYIYGIAIRFLHPNQSTFAYSKILFVFMVSPDPLFPSLPFPSSLLSFFSRGRQKLRGQNGGEGSKWRLSRTGEVD